MHRARRFVPVVLVGVMALAVGCASDPDEPSPGSLSPATIEGSAHPATSAVPTAAPDTGYRPTSARVNGSRGSNTFDVTMPQVVGGPAPARERFNSGMRTTLDDLIGDSVDLSVEDGSVWGDERSRVATISDRVLAGVTIYSWYGKGAAHPNNSVATIVIDTDDAQPILLTDIFIDTDVAARRLAELVPGIDDRPDPPLGVIEEFLNWIPLAEGLHVYLSVAHALGDYYPLTVPWSQISDLMTPEARETLVP